MQNDDVIAVVEASTARRVLGFAALYALGGVILYSVFTNPPGFVLAALSVILALIILWLGNGLRQATRGQILLRADALVDGAGNVLARVDDIARVDRGMLAFKPSNGFVLTLKSKQPRSWAPGLWWRFGRYLGVGGAVSAGQTKFMAEQIGFMLAQRAAGSPQRD